MRDALFALAMLVVLLTNLLAMGEWYHFADERDVEAPLFSGVLTAVLLAGVALEVSLAIWWLS